MMPRKMSPEAEAARPGGGGGSDTVNTGNPRDQWEFRRRHVRSGEPNSADFGRAARYLSRSESLPAGKHTTILTLLQ